MHSSDREAAAAPDLAALLEASARTHRHLCPRQVLGVRIGLAGARALGLGVPRDDKRLLAIAECDGCFLSGLQAATGCYVDRRTLRVEDYGKVAVTFVDVETEQAVRVRPHPESRERALAAAGDAKSRWHAMRDAYQILSEEALVEVTSVHLQRPVAEIVSRPHVRVDCAGCGEEITNEREIRRGDAAYCRACAGDAYYR